MLAVFFRAIAMSLVEASEYLGLGLGTTSGADSDTCLYSLDKT